jgi:hypothetical protein
MANIEFGSLPAAGKRPCRPTRLFFDKTRGENAALPIALTGVRSVRFPAICSRLLFPEMLLGYEEAGMIALNEWLLSGTQIARLSVQVWAVPALSLSCGDPVADIQR